MKYVNFTLKEMTPEQLKQNPITVHPNQKLIVVYKNILNLNLHILYIIYSKTNSKIQKLGKSNKYLKIYIQNNFYFI